MDKKLRSAFKQVTDQKCKTNWIIVSAASGKVELVKSGTGLSTMMSSFDYEKMQFGFMGVLAVDKVSASSSVVSIRTKLVQVNWIGNAVRSNEINLMMGKQIPIINKFAGAVACVIHAKKTTDVTVRKISYQLYKAQGAHKPTMYDFVNEQVDCSTLCRNDDDSDDDSDSDEDFD